MSLTIQSKYLTLQYLFITLQCFPLRRKKSCLIILQDLLVDRLTQTVDRLREEIDMFETQAVAQLEETKAAQKALSEATTEIEVHVGKILKLCCTLPKLKNNYFS